MGSDNISVNTEGYYSDIVAKNMTCMAPTISIDIAKFLIWFCITHKTVSCMRKNILT